jgi:hypothetical protein
MPLLLAHFRHHVLLFAYDRRILTPPEALSTMQKPGGRNRKIKLILRSNCIIFKTDFGISDV